jgi:hypothetical protein
MPRNVTLISNLLLGINVGWFCALGHSLKRNKPILGREVSALSAVSWNVIR